MSKNAFEVMRNCVNLLIAGVIKYNIAVGNIINNDLNNFMVR